MPDKDLDSWLNEQVQPLPPPPGTFDLISRRARRRRLRRAAVTLASGAAVAAVALVVAANPALLRLNPPAETGQAVAGARSPGPGSYPVNGANQPNGSGRPLTSARASSAPDGGRSPYPGPVPVDFAPSSVTFVSPARAWVIGQAGVPGSCYNGNICTSVAWTPDDGRTWHGEHAPVAGAPGGPNGVSGIRFLDGVNGWAFGPELWATHDGGNSWHAVDTFGQRVTGLETAGNRAYALFANCSGSSGSEFAAGCTSFTLMTSPAGSDAWQPAGPGTSSLSAGGAASSAVIQVAGNEGYLLAPDGTVYSGPLGGTWAKAGTAPCEPGAPQPGGSPSGALLAASGPGHLALACAGPVSSDSVYTSADGGSAWTQSPAAPSPDPTQDSAGSTPVPAPSAAAPGSPEPSATEPASPAGSSPSASTVAAYTPAGNPRSLAAAPGGTLLLATADGIYSLASGASRWRQATAAGGSRLPDGGFSYVGMTSGSDGVALPANTSLHEIWVTADGGRTWTPRPVS